MGGVFRDMPAEEYHATKRVSSSIVHACCRSMAHGRWAMERPEAETDAMRVGTALHFMAETGSLDGYIVAGQCEAITAKGERCDNPGKVRIAGKWYCGVKGHAKGGVPDKIDVVTPDEYARVKGMYSALCNHPATKELLESSTGSEITVFWTDKETGVECKARFDLLSRAMDFNVLVDFKTCQDSSPKNFPSQIIRYGYHTRLAFYNIGAAVAGIPVDYTVIAAVESNQPFAVTAHLLKSYHLESSHRKCRQILKRWAECQASGVWPGYSDQFSEVVFSSWAEREMEQE